MARYLLIIDQGTTRTRASVMDQAGTLIGATEVAVATATPQVGWFEQDALEIWRSVQRAMTDVLLNTSVSPAELASIGITNQRETTIVWDRKTGQPIHAAISWRSNQSAAIAARITTKTEQTLVQRKTGLPVNAYFSASKIRWLLEQVPGALVKAQAGELLFGTVDSWLIWQLTQGAAHVTDVTNASRTLLFDIHQLKWDAELLQLFALPSAILPTVYPSTNTTLQTAAAVTFGRQIPITAIIGDQQASLVGQDCLTKGKVKTTYGTGTFLMFNTGTKALATTQTELLTTLAYQTAGQVPTYALEGTILTAGATIKWLQETLAFFATAAESEYLATKSLAATDLYIVPAIADMGTANVAKGAVFGLTQTTNRSQLTRATWETMAYQTSDLLAAIQKITGVKALELHMDGPAARNRYLQQFQADILGIPVLPANDYQDSAALGAGFLAGMATGYFKNFDHLEQLAKQIKPIKLQLSTKIRQEKLIGWQQAVAAARKFKPRKR
ncbi:FGGY family carbohydrate kinase [Loigolactobacillus backii]|uniref:FGGY family carbohydrate kinase n=1 Tax=Loigolactobacillus backii TaxID=375175 RepID=UPI0007F13723|nr:glycerol kinase GlpK [Loigolactobacillus backii]ANK67073.1 hypothetical protein AYR55_04710 [Loigolactobacillus backii]OLF70684.1 hypothetical protein ACX53_00990 [Loigolactobacillus backii]PIO87718.1 hypothetical protein B8A32_11470 [Loigolactobacillus backii]